MDKKTLNDITEKYDNTSPDQLRADLAVLTAINKRSGEILKIIKTAWEHDHDGGDKETVNIAGVEAGEISLGKGGDGKYTVTDERAYGALLHDNDFMIPGGQPAAEQVWMPRREAMDAKYLEDMIRDHGMEAGQTGRGHVPQHAWLRGQTVQRGTRPNRHAPTAH